MLCYDGQLRNSFVLTHFPSDKSTATKSATGGYVTVPERPSRNEEPTSRNEGQTRNNPTSYLVLPHNLYSEIKRIFAVQENDILS